MATLSELKKELVSETASVRARKREGIPWQQQQDKCQALAMQIVAMEKAEQRMSALLHAIDVIAKPAPEQRTSALMTAVEGLSKC